MDWGRGRHQQWSETFHISPELQPRCPCCSCCLPIGCCLCKSHPKLINSPCHEPKSRVQQTPSSSAGKASLAAPGISSRRFLLFFVPQLWLHRQDPCWGCAAGGEGCGVTSLWLPEGSSCPTLQLQGCVQERVLMAVVPRSSCL